MSDHYVPPVPAGATAAWASAEAHRLTKRARALVLQATGTSAWRPRRRKLAERAEATARLAEFYHCLARDYAGGKLLDGLDEGGVEREREVAVRWAMARRVALEELAA